MKKKTIYIIACGLALSVVISCDLVAGCPAGTFWCSGQGSGVVCANLGCNCSDPFCIVGNNINSSTSQSTQATHPSSNSSTTTTDPSRPLPTTPTVEHTDLITTPSTPPTPKTTMD